MKEFILIDTEKKIISIKSDSNVGDITIKELYSYLMDLFDEPEFMRYELPIESTNEGEFKLINGWSISTDAKKHLNGKLVKDN